MNRLAVRGAQAKLARELNLAPTTVSNWANGRNIPEPDRWVDIERALDLPPGTLTTLARPPGAVDLLDELRTEIQRMGAELQQLRDEVAQLRNERQPAAPAATGSRRVARSTPR